MSSNLIKIKRALISVTDKSNIDIIIRVLKKYNIEVLSTGGTAKILRKNNINVIEVADYTKFPEILDGRVKTLHPKIHGGLLGRNQNNKHKNEMKKYDIQPIELVVANLYPFSSALDNNLNFQECIENIDIGGPSMIRSAAKNHENVCVITNVEDYEVFEKVLDKNNGNTSYQIRRNYAAKAFMKTAYYDSIISQWFNKIEKIEWPETISIPAKLINKLRYGENPHQNSAVYETQNKKINGVIKSKQIQGKPLSYNNLNDADAAFELIQEFNEPTIAIIKHANPCGVASNKNIIKAWKNALRTDPQSAFGGIVACNQEIKEKEAAEMNKLFLEVILAPKFSKKALKIFSSKKNLRLLQVKMPKTKNEKVFKQLSDGFLLQDQDNINLNIKDLKVVTKKKPSKKELENLIFAFKVSKHTKSNAIIYAKNLTTVGIGAGQMSRIDSTKIAAIKSNNASKLAKLKTPMTSGSVLASDAFFPFPDGLIAAAKAGITAVIQPGGSIKDKEVIEAANKLKVSMVFTGIRHFRH